MCMRNAKPHPGASNDVTCFQVGCHKTATRIRACAHFDGNFEWGIMRMREFSSLVCDNQPEKQSISSWLSKNCDENSHMRKISYSKFPPKCAHARILVAIFGQPTGNRLYSGFLVGCPKIATRIRACAHF